MEITSRASSGIPCRVRCFGLQILQLVSCLLPGGPACRVRLLWSTWTRLGDARAWSSAGPLREVPISRNVFSTSAKLPPPCRVCLRLMSSVPRPMLFSAPTSKVERSSFCQSIIRARMSQGLARKAPIFDDMKTFRGTDAPTASGILGGFPCQET